jgi:GNAT superfamily N-acetyltransferase
VIRAATSQDIPAMASVWLDSALTAYAHIFPPEAPKPTHSSLCDALGNDAPGFVVEKGGVIVGIVQVADGWLSHLYVAPSHWGQGVGRLLHDAAVELGGRQLWVLRKNDRARSM